MRNTKLDKQVASKILDECRTGDIERDHKTADFHLCELLKQLGYVDVVAAWEKIEKFYA